jgi:hypothetical protein
MSEHPRTCETCQHFGELANYLGRKMAPCSVQAIRSKEGMLLAERLMAPEASCAQWELRSRAWDDNTSPGGAP